MIGPVDAYIIQFFLLIDCIKKVLDDIKSAMNVEICVAVSRCVALEEPNPLSAFPKHRSNATMLGLSRVQKTYR